LSVDDNYKVVQQNFGPADRSIGDRLGVVVQMKKVVSLSVLVLAVAATAGPVQAKDAWYNGFYVGAGGGAGRIESTLAKLGVEPDSTINPSHAQYQEELDHTSFKETGITSKIFAGYRFFDYFAVEGGWLKIHSLEDQPCFIDTATRDCSPVPGVPPVTSDLTDRVWTVEVPMDAWTAYFVGIWPINDTFEAFGKLGAIFWEMKPYAEERVIGGFVPCDPANQPSGNCGPGFASPPPTNSPEWGQDTDGTDLALGAGMNFNSSGGITIRTEFEWFDISATDRTWVLSLSAIYNF
jgi:opacity protein-like surface antigen